MRRARIVLAVLIAVLAGLAVSALAVRWLRPPAEPAWTDDYDVTAQPPEEIAPGTVIERGPPAGWSHLVIKSLPRVRANEVVRLPSNRLMSRDDLARQVAWMFTAFTADVVPERHGHHTRYRIRAIGLGLGANVNGRDTILTSSTAESFGLKPDFFGVQKTTLDIGYRIQQQARVVIHGPSFALVDTPVTFRCGKKNRMVRFRYALLVDQPTGRLDVLAWRLGAESGGCADLSRAVLLRPDTIDEAELIPDLAEFDRLNIPNELAFGVDDLPPNRLEVALPPDLSPLVGGTKFTPDAARTLEDDLRKLLLPQ
ncbi:hypothetical protein [Frigoriglobus tundricola]|uniref:Uncharacterized protein n=1 Tax=Frigoriglobus tundricola TaxID=2774151 RepID=A0A6M5YLP0_9BACT|nr:hypothetical protein [Frigoriglobus tundricola]QJW93902.1 hypothetical protein FTUN_1416 [Frigoriglobus tundricola]